MKDPSEECGANYAARFTDFKIVPEEVSKRSLSAEEIAMVGNHRHSPAVCRTGGKSSGLRGKRDEEGDKTGG